MWIDDVKCWMNWTHTKESNVLLKTDVIGEPAPGEESMSTF